MYFRKNQQIHKRRYIYPSDIFYTHSRLLEKGAQHICGGSITILPIVETKSSDILYIIKFAIELSTLT